MSAETPKLEWLKDGSDDVRERLNYLEEKVSAKASNKKAIEQAADKVKENIPNMKSALQEVAADPSNENILAVAKLTDGRDWGLSGEAQKLYRTEMVVRMQKKIQEGIGIDTGVASQILERSFAEMITDSAKSAEASLFEAMRAVEHDDMLKEDYTKIFGHKYKREAVAKKMEKEGQDDVEVKDMEFTIGETKYRIGEIQVLTGAAMTKIDPRMTNGFILKNAIVLEDGLIFAQMQNGCEGNFVVIKPGNEVYNNVKTPEDHGADVVYRPACIGGMNCGEEDPEDQEEAAETPPPSPTEQAPTTTPQPASQASPTVGTTPGAPNPTTRLPEGGKTPGQIVEEKKDEILTDSGELQFKVLQDTKDSLRDSENNILQLLLAALAAALKESYNAEGNLGETAMTREYLFTYDHKALEENDEIESVHYATASQIILPSDAERTQDSRITSQSTLPTEGVLRVQLQDGETIDILPTDVNGDTVYEIDTSGRATVSERFSLKGRTIEYTGKANEEKSEPVSNETIKQALKNIPLDDMYNELLGDRAFYVDKEVIYLINDKDYQGAWMQMSQGNHINACVVAYAYLKEGDIEGAKKIMKNEEKYAFDPLHKLALFYASVHYALFGEDKFLKQVTSATNEDRTKASQTRIKIIEAGGEFESDK